MHKQFNFYEHLQHPEVLLAHLYLNHHILATRGPAMLQLLLKPCTKHTMPCQSMLEKQQQGSLPMLSPSSDRAIRMTSFQFTAR